MNTISPIGQSNTLYYEANQRKVSKMKKNLLILTFLTLVGFLGTAAHGSGNYHTDTLGNTTDTGNPANGSHQSIFSDFFKNWLIKGLTYTDDGKYVEALHAFDTAFRYDPGEQDLIARAWGGRARVYDALERYDEALVASDEVIHISPHDLKLTESAWVTRGIALRYLGRYEESLEAFNQALALDPDDTRTRQLRTFTQRLINTHG